MGLKIEMLNSFPGWDEIASLERVSIIDIAPAGSIKGVGTGVVLAVGETVKGTVNKALAIADVGDMESIFGGLDRTIATEPWMDGANILTEMPTKGWEGNLYLALARKRFASLVVVRPDTAIRSAGGSKIPFTLTRTPASTTVVTGGVGLTNVTVLDRTGFEKVLKNGEMVDVSVDNPMTVNIGANTGVSVVAVAAGTGLQGVLTLASAINCSGLDAVTRVLPAYTLPGGTVIEGDNYSGDSVQLATMDDVTFAAGILTATVYARPVSEDVCGEAFGADDINEVLVVTSGGIEYPLTTTIYTGDKGAPYPAGQTMDVAALTHDAFAAETWVNIVNNAYAAAIGYATAPGGAFSVTDPAVNRNIIVSARHWAGGATNDCLTIRSALASHVADSALQGVPVITPIRPPLDVTDKTAVRGSSDPGVSANRSDRILYCWPCVNAIVPELDATTEIATGFDFWTASVLSQLNPEENPAQYHNLIDGRGITSIQRIKSSPTADERDLNFQDYKDFKASGISAPAYSSSYGWNCYSGVTTSLTSGREGIARRRMADFVGFSIARSLEDKKSKLPKRKLLDSMEDVIFGFLDGLKSEDNADTQRIEDFSLDTTSGNTATTSAKKIRVIKYQVKMLSSMDSFAVFAEVGENVNVGTD